MYQDGVKIKKKILFFSIKQRKKSWSLGAISYFGKTSLYLYEENFDTDIYINVMKEAMLEIKEFNGEENVVMQMDNARYHWKNQVLQFYQKIILRYNRIFSEWNFYFHSEVQKFGG